MNQFHKIAPFFVLGQKKNNYGMKSKSISVVIKNIQKMSTIFDIFGPVYVLTPHRKFSVLSCYCQESFFS